MIEVQKKNTFFFLLPSGSTFDLQVKGTIKWAESKKKYQISFWILEREYLGPSGQRYELASEVQINLCFSEREYLTLIQIGH